jgi:putative ABC transport system permease protein
MIFRLALKDVIHDWLLSICLVLAIASIIAPLLILFGLQFGTIETLRNRLVQDPKNREIRPLTTRSFTREWFDTLRTSSGDIAFVVPMTRQIASSVTASNATGELKESLALMATAAGDPLLLENGVTVPPADGCVLTESAAHALDAKVGDSLTFSAQRIIRGRYEHGTFSVRIAGILEERASSLRTAYVQLEVIEAVEDFKDGRAVPLYGWQGELPTAYPVFEGVTILVPEPLSKLEEVLLINNTGFSHIQRLAADQAAEILGYAPGPEWSVYLARVKQRAASEANIEAIVNQLRGKGARVVPWIEPLEVTLTSAADSRAVALKLHTITDETGVVTGMTGPQGNMAERDDKRWLVVVSPEDSPAAGEATLSLKVNGRDLEVPVTIVKGGVPTGRVHAAASFAGTLNLLRYREVRYDDKAAELLLSRQGYAGFRLYAATIDDVDTVQQRLEQEGITVHTERERIGEVRRLDHYTTLIFWLIAAVGVVGAIAALTASLYASVERKKKELNVLRLLGLLKRELVLFPIFQGLLLSSGALVLSVTIFAAVSQVINRVFSDHLQTTESLCTLSGSHFLLLAAGVLGLSTVSATFAALRATRLDPAEALRDE